MCSRTIRLLLESVIPTDTLPVEIEIGKRDASLELTEAALARTARLLMDSHGYVRGSEARLTS